MGIGWLDYLDYLVYCHIKKGAVLGRADLQ